MYLDIDEGTVSNLERLNISHGSTVTVSQKVYFMYFFVDLTIQEHLVYSIYNVIFTDREKLTATWMVG